jgi:hypothetical protein
MPMKEVRKDKSTGLAGRVVSRWRGLTPPDGLQRRLALLTLARCGLALLFLLNILPLGLRDGWFLYHEAGEEHIFALADSLAWGPPRPSPMSIAQPLVMLPWIRLLRPDRFADVIIPLALINGLLLGGLSVPVIGSVARHTLGSDRVAVWAAAVWAFLPLLAYCGFFWHTSPGPEIVRSTAVPRLGWLDGLTDGPAIFFSLLAILLLARIAVRPERATFRQMAGVGVTAGVAVMYRIQMAPMMVFLAGCALLAHGWRALAALCGAALIVYLPQVWYNQVIYGLPLTVGYTSFGDMGTWGGTLDRPLADILSSLPFSRDNLVILWNYTIGRNLWLAVPLVLMLIAGAHVVRMLWVRQGWKPVALLIGAPLSYLGPMVATESFRYDIARFMLPVVPFMVIACVLAVDTALRQLPVPQVGRDHPRSGTL